MRTELMPGVWLRAVQTDKFKTACFSVNFLLQLTPQIAPHNALLPAVLLRGTERYPDMLQISDFLDEHYGASFGTLVRKKGDVVTCGFYADFVEDAFLPAGEKIFDAMTDFLRQVLFEPLLDADGLFRADYVESEKRNLINAIEARVNDKRTYAMTQMLRRMCQGDPYGVPRLGEVESAKKITPRSLLDYYRTLLHTAPVELFYMGRMPEPVVCEAMARAFAPLGAREVRPVSVAPLHGAVEPRSYAERMRITQGKLCMGLRTDCSGGSDVYPAVQMFNAIFGGGVSSKLFANVREKQSLCYYASSTLERFKGILCVSSGIEFDREQVVREEILRQLQCCCDGEITADELETARRFLLSGWRAGLDSPTLIDDFYLGQTLLGDGAGMDDWIERLARVTKEEVVAAARRVSLDTIYFLKGADA